MSELKAYTIYEGDVGNYTEHVVYSKSEADEVIADKDAKILALDAEVFKQKHHAKLFLDERNYVETQLRHSNRKRCLAMAKWCAAECVVNQNTYKRFLTRKPEFRIGHFRKWYKRWLKLAEKFKEGV